MTTDSSRQVPPDPKTTSEPTYGTVEGVAHIARLSVPALLEGVLGGQIRTRRIHGALLVAVEDALVLAAGSPGPAPAAGPLAGKVKAQRGAGGELSLRSDGDDEAKEATP
jgi:hypothetical protein